MKPNSPPSEPEVIVFRGLPQEAREVGTQPMRCERCGRRYSLPIYEMPDGPVASIARCPGCGSHSNQVPVEVAA